MNESPVALPPPPDVVEAFTSAALTALEELTHIEAYAEAASPTAAADRERSEPVVCASVRLLRRIPGTMSLVLTTDVAARLAARYLPPGATLTDEMIDDVVGEFANVIAGQSKTMLKGTPFHFTLSTPTVVRAASFSQRPASAFQLLVGSLVFEEGELLLCVDLLPCPGA